MPGTNVVRTKSERDYPERIIQLHVRVLKSEFDRIVPESQDIFKDQIYDFVKVLYQFTKVLITLRFNKLS